MSEGVEHLPIHGYEHRARQQDVGAVVSGSPQGHILRARSRRRPTGQTPRGIVTSGIHIVYQCLYILLYILFYFISFILYTYI